jgi:hypothetical protein
MKTLPLTITHADYLASTKRFTDNRGCPLFQAVNRQYPELGINYVETRQIFALPDGDIYPKLHSHSGMRIDPVFKAYDYDQLVDNPNLEFHTTILIED